MAQKAFIFTIAVMCAATSLFDSVLACDRTMNCISYDPFSHPKYIQAEQEPAISKDLVAEVLVETFGKLKELGFRCVKTYYSTYYGNNVAEFAANAGLKIVLGMKLDDPALIDANVEAAALACTTYANKVVAIYVGNEDVYTPANVYVPEAAAPILQVRDTLRGKGCTKPIGTSQMLVYYKNAAELKYPEWQQLKTLDFYGYNVYPWFTALTDGKSSADMLRDQINVLKQLYPAEFEKNKFIITETGWPSAGGVSEQGNEATLANAQEYADAVAAMRCGELKTRWMSYFLFTDPTYKEQDSKTEFEKFFGVADATGNPKWDLSALARCPPA